MLNKRSLGVAAILIAAAFAVGLLNSTGAPAQPAAIDREISSDYAGLEFGAHGCDGMFKVPARPSGPAHCTHGPDPMPPHFSRLHTTPARPNTNAPATVQCDGDGTSGKRVQVIYAHALDVPDNFSTYVVTLTNYTAGMDSLFNDSAAQTGGTRHLRFVHDLSCFPIISSVTLSPTGDDSLLNTITELEAHGYQDLNRKYVVFMDAAGGCGISTMSYDDLWTGQNPNNIGDTFGLIYKSCWSDVIAAHELMHQLGALQLSAPHATSDHHCYDGYDNMCRPTDGTPLQIICADLAQGSLFDCNHDDYFSTDASPGSYLDTHWNTAVSQFFVLPPAVRVGLLQTMQQTESGLTAADTFFYTHTVHAQAYLVDQYNLALQNAEVAMGLYESNGSLLCSFTVHTDSDGIGKVVCSLGGTLAQPLSAQVTSFSYSNYPTDTVHSSLKHTFNVLWGSFFPLLSR